MYTLFYEFSEKPFNVSPDPRFLYQTASHRESFASMIYGIKERKGFISIIGEVGTGKTTLIYALLKHLDEKINTVFIFHTNITFDQLLKNILLELGIPVGQEEKTALLRLLNEYLIQKLSQDENLAVIIDEAQNLSKEVMEELRMLSNLETPHSKLLQIVLVGQPELEAKLNSENLRQLRQRIGIRRQIMPLSGEECREYIDHRLKLVGSSSSKIFTTEAVTLICDYAKGIPRAINILCDNALLIGYSLSRKKIDAKIIYEVIRDMEGSLFERRPAPFKPPPVNVSQSSPPKLGFLSNKTSLFILSLFCLALLVFFGKEYFQKSSTNPRERKDFENISTDINLLTAKTDMSKVDMSKVDRKVKEIVTARKNDCITSLGQKFYHNTNETLLDFILETNPEIANIHLIRVDQQIKIPEITGESLIIRSPDGSFKIYLGTFLSSESAEVYHREPVLQGKEFEVIPRKVSPNDTWYRITVGKFNNKEECLEVISILREKGLLPIFKRG